MIINIIAVIQARLTSTRLPGKIFKNIGKKTVLDWVIDAIPNGPGIKPVIAIPDNEENAVIEAKYSSILSVFKGSEEDVMKRLIDTGKSFEADYILRICSDNPFIQTRFILELTDAVKEHEWDYVAHYEGQTNCIMKPYGFFAEIFSLSKAEALYRNTDTFQREHVTPIFYTEPQKYNVRIKRIDIPDLIAERPYLRFTLDNDYDLELFCNIYKEKPADYYGYDELINIIENNEHLKQKMIRNKREGNK